MAMLLRPWLWLSRSVSIAWSQVQQTTLFLLLVATETVLCSAAAVFKPMSPIVTGATVSLEQPGRVGCVGWCGQSSGAGRTLESPPDPWLPANSAEDSHEDSPEDLSSAASGTAARSPYLLERENLPRCPEPDTQRRRYARGLDGNDIDLVVRNHRSTQPLLVVHVAGVIR